MSEYSMSTAPQPIAFGASGREEIEQNIRLIVSTASFSVRGDCRFADTAAYIDSPLPFEAARRIAVLTEAIEEYEPRVRVIKLYFSQNQEAAPNMVDGRLYPILRYAMQEEL